MAINLAYLEMRLSGGGSNTDPLSALGGAKSSHRIYSASATGLSTVTGITIDDAPGVTAGAGTLAFTASGQTLTWTPHDGTAGDPVAVGGASQRYAIPGVNGDTSIGYLFVTVTTGSLPGTNQSDAITVTLLANELFDDITKSESLSGDDEYRCFYLHNAHGTDPFIGIKVFIAAAPSGNDALSIGLDPAGIGNGSSTGVATTIGGEGSAPAGVTFTAPMTSGTGLAVGDLAASESAAVWECRSIPAETLISVPSDVSAIGIFAGY